MAPDDRLDELVSIFETNKQAVFRYIHHLVGRMGLRGSVTEDDILAEVALVACQKAIRSPTSIPDDPKRVTAWLMRIALYTCLNRYRRGRTERRAMEVYESIAREHELRSVLEEDAVHIRLEIQSFLDTLEKSDKDLLELCFFGSLTSEEIGQRLRLNPATVRMKKARLLSKLQEHLTK